jgi:hypothetical protein
MLKLHCTDNELFMEHITGSALEIVVAQRVLLAIRSGQPLHIEPGQASFLLPATTTGLAELDHPGISIDPVDAEFVEVTVPGTWLAERTDAEEGVFMMALGEGPDAGYGHKTEALIYKLWQSTQPLLSALT